MNNSALGLTHMMQNADAVIWLTAITLLVMSVISWTLIIAKGRRTQKIRKSVGDSIAAFWQSDSLVSGLEKIKPSDASGSMSGMVHAAIALQKTPEGQSLDSRSAQEDRITRGLRSALHNATSELESGLVTLASIGATSPFVGLFGTVWSIYQALVSISGESQVMLEQVSGPVGEALIMTAFGLFVAIPAVLAYNALTRSNRIILAELDGFANDLRAHLLQAKN
jgi:biopolymer transport protein ExbB